MLIALVFLPSTSGDALGFTIYIAVATLWGVGLRWWGVSPSSLSPKHAMIAAAISWVMISALGALPFYIIATQTSGSDAMSATLQTFATPINALFESTSGMTSTGLTLATKPSELPDILLLWRSLMQWVGGFGFIILIVLFLDPSDDHEQLFSTELNQRPEADGLTRAAIRILAIYLGFTVASIFALSASGSSFWEALNHGLTAISTGGFTIDDDSVSTSSRVQQFVLCLIMICGAFSFATHDKILKGQFGAFINGQSLRLLIIIFIGVLLIILADAVAGEDTRLPEIAFMTISAGATAGFANTDISEWSQLSLFIIFLLMFVGAASGSTGGGLKISRATLLIRVHLRFCADLLRTPGIQSNEEKKLFENIPTSDARRLPMAQTVFFFWVVTLVIGAFLLAVVTQAPWQDVVFETTSALGGVGLSVGLTDPALPATAKLILMSLMIMGRLEIVPLLVLVRSLLTRSGVVAS